MDDNMKEKSYPLNIKEMISANNCRRIIEENSIPELVLK